MKANQFFKLTIPVFCFIACAGKQPSAEANKNIIKDTALTANKIPQDTFETGKVISQVLCQNDTTQSYALYIPVKGNKTALPVIYFFDPHADGSLPLNKYKTLADTYNFILASSNNSKNGNDWATAENIWRSLFDDTQKRLRINSNRIYTCGFSGGAKVAGYAALHHKEVKAVIANGAGLPDGTAADNFNFSFTAVAGEGDMNMTDLVSFNNDLDKTKTTHRIIFFDGKHEWAPVNTMNIAFAGLQLDAMREKLIQKDDGFINEYIIKSKKRFDEYFSANKLIKAGQECTLSVNMLEGLTNEVNWYKEKDTLLINNPNYQKQWKAQQNLLATEQNIKAGYMQQFQQGDLNYWSKTISGLQSKAKASTAEAAMYQRLLAFLSLAFYSISNRLIMNNQNSDAQYFVGLYKMADPGNSEAWYFSAMLDARNSNSKAAEADLMKAVECGFNDKSRLMQQPEFKNMATSINFSAIESKMKKSK